MTSVSNPVFNLPQKMLYMRVERFAKMIEASPLFKDSHSQYDNYVAAPKCKVPTKFAMPDLISSLQGS